MSLSSARIQEIEAMAKDILDLAYGSEGGLRKPPIDVHKIAGQAGLTIKFGHFEDGRISGYYDQKSREIYVSDEEFYSRKLFTIAHEIGHFFLHKDKQNDTFYRLDDIQLDFQEKKDEQEANWFAACLLMPAFLVNMYWGISHNVEEMATFFQVSASAMVWRLRNLGLIPLAHSK